MEKKEIKSLAEAFCAKGKSYRKSEEGVAEFNALAQPVQAKVREIVEANRGFRRVNGSLEFTEEALKAQIERLEVKKADMEARLPVLENKISDLKDELAERFGDNNK
jgi:predicted nuclease with TOPRIM domain